MKRRTPLHALLLATGAFVLGLGLHVRAQDPQPDLVIDDGFHHLGDDTTPEWPEASAEPEGSRLDLRFRSQSNSREWVLVVTQRHVNNRWQVLLNGREVAVLATNGVEPGIFRYPIPAGAVRSGSNTLAFVAGNPADDITLGRIGLIKKPFRYVLRLRPVEMLVTNGGDGRPLPARLTIVDADGNRPPLYFPGNIHTALRDGVAYAGRGRAEFEIPAGRYTVYASRGLEWSVAKQSLDVDAGERSLSFSLVREVDTRGFIAADTHIHTYTFSGHGDSTVEERLSTLAGEGVELAIATDHNHQTDYRPLQAAMQLNEYFTAVTGNEVTTRNGHFNAFPLDPEGEVPPHDVQDWVTLVQGIRDKGAKVVILNHPRWPALDTGPLGIFRFDRHTGARHEGPAFTFDAMELANSTALLEDPMYLFVDWFALLNHGEKITAVGSSDSHTVAEPVGQGRTYVRSSTDDPAAIDVAEACEAFRRGDTSVSLGLFAEVEVEGRPPGELIRVERESVRVQLRLAAPSWSRPTRVTVFVNGIPAVVRDLDPTPGLPFDRTLEIEVPRPPQDAWLVCLALGPGVKEPYWNPVTDYVLAATNPVWLDVDGDGAWSSPRETAAAVLAAAGADPEALVAALQPYDAAVKMQAAGLARRAYLEDARSRLDELGKALAPTGVNLDAWLQQLPQQH